MGNGSTMSVIQRASVCVLLVVGSLLVTNTWAQDIWFGRPTARDFLAANVRRGIEQYSALQQSLAQFQSQIEDARQAYFAAPASKRAAAGDKFGELLFQKDLLIAYPRMLAGDNPSVALAGRLMVAGRDGRPVDGGIAPSAVAAFSGWISAVQFNSGAVFGRTGDPTMVQSAMLSGDGAQK